MLVDETLAPGEPGGRQVGQDCGEAQNSASSIKQALPPAPRVLVETISSARHDIPADKSMTEVLIFMVFL